METPYEVGQKYFIAHVNYVELTPKILEVVVEHIQHGYVSIFRNTENGRYIHVDTLSPSRAAEELFKTKEDANPAYLKKLNKRYNQLKGEIDELECEKEDIAELIRKAQK